MRISLRQPRWPRTVEPLIDLVQGDYEAGRIDEAERQERIFRIMRTHVRWVWVWEPPFWTALDATVGRWLRRRENHSNE